MARVTYEPTHVDESLQIDPETNQPLVITHGPKKDDWMILVVLINGAIAAVIVVILLGLGFMDLAFGTT